MNILIVDDQPINLEILRAQLIADGHAVQQASNGVEALALLERQPVDAIISDILMPEMDGYRLCYEVRRSERLRQIPFIFYTATYTAPADETLSYELGGDQYLRKPASREAVQAALQQVLSRPRPTHLPIAAPAESATMKEYSERLVNKLEEKNAELSAALEQLKKNEAALREATAVRNAILDSASYLIIATGSEGRIHTVNRAAEQMLGYAAQELKGKTPELLHDPAEIAWRAQEVSAELAREIAPSVEVLLATPRSTGKYEERQWTYIRKNGSRFPVQLAVAPLRDAQQQLIGFVAIGADITERRRAEDALRESERRFSDMMRNLTLVSVMLDDQGRITYCNDYLLRLTGWQRPEVIGRDWFELFIPPENTEVKRVFADLLAGKPSAWHHENDILIRSGERRLIRWNNTVLRSGSGQAIGTASIGEDITTRRHAEEIQQKRTEDLERFHRLSVGRELQMIDLKKEVNAWARRAGQPPPYDLSFVDEESAKEPGRHG